MGGFSLWTAGWGWAWASHETSGDILYLLTFRDSGKANILSSIRHSYLSGKELVLRAGFDEEKGRQTGERMWATAWGWYHGRNFKLQDVNGCWKRYYGMNKPLLLHHIAVEWRHHVCPQSGPRLPQWWNQRHCLSWPSLLRRFLDSRVKPCLFFFCYPDVIQNASFSFLCWN